jgi:hypothetical protein
MVRVSSHALNSGGRGFSSVGSEIAWVFCPLFISISPQLKWYWIRFILHLNDLTSPGFFEWASKLERRGGSADVPQPSTRSSGCPVWSCPLPELPASHLIIDLLQLTGCPVWIAYVLRFPFHGFRAQKNGVLGALWWRSVKVQAHLYFPMLVYIETLL